MHVSAKLTIVLTLCFWLCGCREPAAATNKDGKPSEEWNWQDLQTHLASKGVETDRRQGRKGMWFADGTGKQLDFYAVQSYDDGVYPIGAFVVVDHHSPKAAKRDAAQTRDTDQRDAFSWSKFVFEGHNEKLVALEKLLR